MLPWLLVHLGHLGAAAALPRCVAVALPTDGQRPRRQPGAAKRAPVALRAFVPAGLVLAPGACPHSPSPRPIPLQSLIAKIKANTPGADDIIISTHCQNDLGLSTANSLAGAMGGARQVRRFRAAATAGAGLAPALASAGAARAGPPDARVLFRWRR